MKTHQQNHHESLQTQKNQNSVSAYRRKKINDTKTPTNNNRSSIKKPIIHYPSSTSRNNHTNQNQNYNKIEDETTTRSMHGEIDRQITETKQKEHNNKNPNRKKRLQKHQPSTTQTTTKSM